MSQQEWWRDAVIYQVYPRSWADADGDGMGDLPGITARLPYLADLGVDAVWLSPFYPSPQNDAGYDVSDYRDVDPRFGSLADADALIARAHDLGLRVHRRPRPQPLLERAPVVPGGPGRRRRAAPARARYVFRDGRGRLGEEPPNNWVSQLRRARLDAGDRAGRDSRPVVPPPVRRHPARLRLDEPRGRRRVGVASCGSGSTGASTASGSTSPTAWSRTRACPTRRPPTR